MNDILQPSQSYSKMYGTEPWYNKILNLTKITLKLKRKIYPDITNLCQHMKQTNIYKNPSILFSKKTATFQSMAHCMYMIDIGTKMLYYLF